MQWPSNIPAVVWVLLITPIVLALAAKGGTTPVQQDSDGWRTMRPSLVLYVLGLLSVVMVAFFIGMAEFALRDISRSGAATSLILSLLTIVFFLYMIYGSVVVRTRFNDKGMEHRGLVKRVFVPWTDVRRIRHHPFWGPYAETGRGGILISMYFNGFSQFIAEAARHGVEIPESLLRTRS